MVSESALVKRLAAMCRQRGVDQVVVGFPLSADGSEGPGCARARRVAEKLTATGLRVVLQDESWSSREAEEILREVGKTRRSAPHKVDAIAASLILRDFLSEASRP